MQEAVSEVNVIDPLHDKSAALEHLHDSVWVRPAPCNAKAKSVTEMWPLLSLSNSAKTARILAEISKSHECAIKFTIVLRHQESLEKL